jgi:hypothetical protein
MKWADDWATRGLLAIEAWNEEHAAEIAERDALLEELHYGLVRPGAWWHLECSLKEADVPDEEILARRAYLLPRQRRLEALQESLNASCRAHMDAWRAANPQPPEELG